MEEEYKGKEICRILREIRISVAKEYGIVYTPKECHHEGDCSGTCPACENELEYLNRMLEKKSGDYGRVSFKEFLKAKIERFRLKWKLLDMRGDE